MLLRNFHVLIGEFVLWTVYKLTMYSVAPLLQQLANGVILLQAAPDVGVSETTAA